jgi:predicted nucleotidyltransferase
VRSRDQGLELSQIRPFDSSKLPSPWRGVLERELGKLKARSDVLALGLCGSVAQNDIWPGSDLDIEVVVKGDKPKEIFTTEQEVSVDYGYFGENQLSEIPYDTRPVHDPSGILTRELESRVRNEVVKKSLDGVLDRSQKVLGWAEIALAEDPYSALAWVTSASQWLAEIFTLSAGLNWTHRRVVSRLERATTKLHRDDILQDYGKLMGFPRTLERAGELLSELQLGYREIWTYFKGKNGPVYMVQQPDSEAWFKNRIVPLYEYDRRDLVNLVYSEFRFILAFIFSVTGYERTPDVVFRDTARFEGPPAEWTDRYRRILRHFSVDEVPGLLVSAKDLLEEGRALALDEPWTLNR